MDREIFRVPYELFRGTSPVLSTQTTEYVQLDSEKSNAPTSLGLSAQLASHYPNRLALYKRWEQKGKKKLYVETAKPEPEPQ